MRLFSPRIQSIPHSELVPLSEEECSYPTSERNPILSVRDYSEDEIKSAIRANKIPNDMREYCHNNGIAWEIQNGRSRS